MGWGRMLLLGNVGQQLDIEEQRSELRRLRRKLDRGGGKKIAALRDRVAALEMENDELRLYVVAMARYLGAKGVIDQSEFRVLIEEIDASDGTADGRFEGSMPT